VLSGLVENVRNIEQDAIMKNTVSLRVSPVFVVHSWTTIKKREILAQHEFHKPIYRYVYRGIVLICLDTHQKY